MIRRKGGKFVVLDSTGKKVLGIDDSEQAAQDQFSAIEKSVHDIDCDLDEDCMCRCAFDS